jgi:hypothetical protein
MFPRVHPDHLVAAAMFWIATLAGNPAQLVAAPPEGTELTFLLILNAADFAEFVLPDHEDAIGILLQGPDGDGSSDNVYVLPELSESFAGPYDAYGVVPYITKGGVYRGATLYWGGLPSSDRPACLRLGAEANLIVESYLVSPDGNGNLIADPEGGSVAVFVHGTF